MLNFNSILLFSEKPKELAKFYKQVLEVDSNMDGGDYFGFLVGNGYITIGPHDKVKGKSKNPERILINLETEDVEEEFKRIEKIKGAIVIAKPYSPMEGSDYKIATFADPDGNYFQLVTPWDYEEKDTSHLN